MPSTGEITLILLAILILFGGKGLPKISRTLGHWMSIFQRSITEIRREINRVALEEELHEKEKEHKSTPTPPQTGEYPKPSQTQENKEESEDG